MTNTMYRVSTVGQDGSPWELLAHSGDHAILTVRKFYPHTANKELKAEELTLSGEPISLVHVLRYGENFHTILHTNSGRPAIKGPEYVRGDFDPTKNLYICHEVNSTKTIYLNPYDKIIRKEV